MKHSIGMFVVVAMIGTLGMSFTALAGDNASQTSSSSNEPVWSTDTVSPMPPKEVKAPAPKAEPYSGPVWSTDSTTPVPPKVIPMAEPTQKPYTGPAVAPPPLALDPSYKGPVWSTDTVSPAPPREVKAPAPKSEPYQGPTWSTDPGPQSK